METALILSVLGAACAVCFGGAGSSLGIGTAGMKGAGVLAENPNLFGKVLVMMLLPGSQGIYGLLIAILILSNAGFLGGGEIAVTFTQGAKYLGAGLAIGLAGLFSGWFQGKVAAAAIGAAARDESLAGRLITLTVMVETYAIFGLLIALFLVLL